MDLDDNLKIAREEITNLCIPKETKNAEACAPSYCLFNKKCYLLDETNPNLIGREYVT